MSTVANSMRCRDSDQRRGRLENTNPKTMPNGMVTESQFSICIPLMTKVESPPMSNIQYNRLTFFCT